MGDWPSDFASPYHLYIIFLVILFSVFFLNAHIQVYEKKTATTTKTLTCGQEIFSSKNLGFSSDDTHQKIDPKKPIPPPPKKYKNPVFTAMYPLMIQFFTRTTKKYQQKKKK